MNWLSGLIFSLMLIVFPGLSWAKAGGGMPGSLMELAADTRTLSMGRAGVANPESGPYCNPAGEAFIDRYRMQIMLINTATDSNYHFLHYKHLFPSVSLGISLVGLSMEGIEHTDHSGNSLGLYDYENSSVIITRSQLLSPKTSFGINYRTISKDYSGVQKEESAKTFDIGLLSELKEGLRLGICLQNLFSPTLPREGGGRQKVSLNIKAGIETMLWDRLRCNFDLEKGSDRRLRICAGTEYLLLKDLRLRAGYDDGLLTAGLGWNGKNHLILDYALLNYDYGLNHSFSCSLQFGPTRAELKEKAEKEAREEKLKLDKLKEQEELTRTPALGLPPKMANIAVADFEPEQVSQIEASFVSDVIRRTAVNSRVFKVVDKQNMERILAEHAFQQTGCTNEECAVEIGNLLNVNYMIIGKLSRINEVYYIWARLVDVETSEIILDESEECTSSQPKDMEKAAMEVIMKMIAKLTGKASLTQEVIPPISKLGKEAKLQREVPCVMQVSADKAVINRGLYDRVKIRDVYEVYQEAELVGLLRIESASPEQASGKIVRIKEGKKIEPGMAVVYKGRRKIGGIGLMLGPVKGEISTGFGGALYYDYVAASGWGFQVGLGGYGWDEYEYTYTSSSNSSESYSKSIDIWYAHPILFKYHFNYDTPISAYIGAGLAKAEHDYYYYYWYNYYQWNYYSGSENRYDRKEDSMDEWVPVLNFGVDFFATSIVHLNLDWKYFMGGNFYGYDTDTRVICGGISLNW